MNDRELQEKHFRFLAAKYQVNKIEDISAHKFLYLILRKADLGIQVSDLELNYLAKNNLFTTVDIIQLQQYAKNDITRLNSEFLQLRVKYRIPETIDIPIHSSIYWVLVKLDCGNTLEDSELELLNSQGFAETVSLVQEIRYFAQLKNKYKATHHLDRFPESSLYPILKKVEAKEQLNDSEAEWLLEASLEETLEIYWQQEEQRKAELEFLELKSKYQVSDYPDYSISSPLFSILKKLDENEDLSNSECEWLEQEKLHGLVTIDQQRKDRKSFAQLKEKYKATQYSDSEPSSHLYTILRNLELNQLKVSNLSRDLQILLDNPQFKISEQDINWLIKEELHETAEIAQKLHFKYLKNKYQIIDPRLPINPFYEIMLKLEREERLDPKQVVQLIEENQLSRSGKIAIAHYRLEAIFYEKEYKRTGNRWNLPSASSNWRKANESDKALKVTDQINWTKVRESALKSALLVTRGAAFRDLRRLDEAEDCATQAIESQPESHQPYTLMGAICYDRSEYSDGDEWFEMAAERGAVDTDDEIERIVRMTKDKDKRREVAEYLLKKDPDRYAWASSYLK
ncbi:MAG: hypothetical protein RIE73_03700 [Coleofasciculus sp. C1-SOL-03]|uniref:hypothetical protein n=1 Tax=Coleofasciculus sp. C1-SOL-03 TaxID=3069522 RepID=UPI0032FA1A95